MTSEWGRLVNDPDCAFFRYAFTAFPTPPKFIDAAQAARSEACRSTQITRCLALPCTMAPRGFNSKSLYSPWRRATAIREAARGGH